MVIYLGYAEVLRGAFYMLFRPEPQVSASEMIRGMEVLAASGEIRSVILEMGNRSRLNLPLPILTDHLPTQA